MTTNRAEIIERCRVKIASRPAPRPTDAELEHGVPLFLDQLVEALRVAQPTSDAMVRTAIKHGDELLHRGFTVAQVVHDYGGICQTITELAIEKAAPITTAEFKTLNRCLDDAIAAAVGEYGRLREHEGTERLGRLAHELRNLLGGASLAFEMLQRGSVHITGNTGTMLGRSLAAMRSLIARELTEVRLGAGLNHEEDFPIAALLEDLEVAASLEAGEHGMRFSVGAIDREVIVHADREILASVITNLLQNAFKFSRPGGHVVLRAHTTADRVSIDVADECGGLPPGTVETLFDAFEQRGADRSGLGLGLSVCLRGAEVNHGALRVVDHPGHGCVFTIDVPRSPASHHG